MTPFFTEIDCEGSSVFVSVDGNTDRKLIISLDKANELIRQRGKVVYFGISGTADYMGVSRQRHSIDTHRGLLICVEEIEADNAEKILNDLLATYQAYQLADHKGLSDVISRAKALLAKGKI